MITRRALLASAFAQAPRPNVLFVLTDDQGWASIGTQGNKLVPTPHLDRLAGEGVRFTQAYVTPQCTPTRATIFTGQYTARHKMWHVIPWYGYPQARVREEPCRESLERGEFTLAHAMKNAGYATGCFGKWHLTANADGNYTSLNAEAAKHYGFDAVAKPFGARETGTGDKAVDRLTNEAIEFMRMNRERPFFCYLPHHTIHGPVSAPDKLIAKYRDSGYPETGLNNATYLAAIEHMDASIGRLTAALDELRIADRTMVVFLSDNGGVFRTWQPHPKGAQLTEGRREFSNAPLREGKGSAYEGGIRVPMIVRGPGAKRGLVSETPVHAVDLLPTFAAAAKARVPGDHKLDGVDLAPLLRGGTIAPRPLYWYMPFYDVRWGAVPSAVMRDGDWKSIWSFGDSIDEKGAYRVGERLELFNLRDDVGESKNLAAAQPERVARMKRQLKQWIESCGSRVPVENPKYDAAQPLFETRER